MLSSERPRAAAIRGQLSPLDRATATTASTYRSVARRTAQAAASSSPAVGTAAPAVSASWHASYDSATRATASSMFRGSRLVGDQHNARFPQPASAQDIG